ncbi:MAG: ferritin family protein [Desulfuromonadales bacterium]
MAGLEDFSGFEVIRSAMEIEKKGHLFYSTVAQRAKSELAREVFSWLAQDEVNHLKTLEELVPRYQEGAFWENEEEFLPYLRRMATEEFFPAPERLEQFLQNEDADLQSLDLAIEAEEKFADYFHRAAENARTPEGREAFVWLAAEENRHAAVLKERKTRFSMRGELRQDK